MRSKFLVSAAIAAVVLAVGMFGSFASLAHAAGAKDKDAKAKPLELHADDKSIKRQTQWEDKVMGPDSTRTELDKIARARAINEKAEKDKEKQAALAPLAPAPKAAPAPAKKSEVSLITPEKNEPARAHEISPKLETAAAQAPVPTAKPADDKFIDKLLRDGGTTKKHASGNDKELESLLGGFKEKPAGRKRGDSVDDILKSAEKGPAMPEPRAQTGGLPEWAKQPEIAPTPAAAPPPPPPVAAKPASKPPSGVIQVVQGAASSPPAAAAAPPKAAPVASRAGRKASVAKASSAWSDPFADKRPVASAQAPKKEPASRPSASTDTSWNDPFATEPETRKAVRRGTPTASPSAPAAPSSAPRKSEPARPAGNGGGGWKDPFTKGPYEPAHTPVAMRELGKGESSKWEIAAHRSTAHASTSEPRAAGGWGVLKKRAR